MADQRYRFAQRDWLENPNLDSWVRYLQESRRIGNPIFTAKMVETYSQGELISFQPTVDGFVARVKKALNPALEETTTYVVHGDYETESFPIWNHWSGQIIVRWSDISSPECPEIEIKIEGLDDYTPLDFLRSTSYYYEYDCVTNEAELRNALEDSLNWTW